MPQYAIIFSHPASECPMTNKRVREFVKNAFAKMPGLQSELGIKTITEIHLDPAHKALSIYEAPSAEIMRDYLFKSGYMQFTQMEFYLATPLMELLKKAEDFPTVFE